MAEIRCPMCGKENPADREICQYCQARLTPLFVSPFDEPADDEEDLTPIDSGGIPDWLKDLRPPGAEDESPEGGWEEPEEKSDEEFAGAPAEAAEEPSGVPDWLERIRKRTEETPAGASAETPTESEPEEPQEERRELPDWLGAGAFEESPFRSTLGDAEPQETPETPEPDQPEGEGEPDWLRRIHDKQSQEPPVEPPPIEVPKFTPIEPTPVEPAEASHEPEQPAEAPPQEPQRTKGMTGWLSTFDKERPSRTTMRRAPEPSAGGEESTPPEWPQDARTQPEGEPAAIPEGPGLTLPELPAEEVADVPFEAPDLSALPDWLAGIAPEEAQAAQPASEQPEPQPNLEEAPLPSWLEAMRPVEAVVPETPKTSQPTTDQVEASGPLAGLRGVLPIEHDVTAPRKSRAYSLKLQIPENQQAHIALLEELLATESTPRPVAQPRAISSQLVLRLVVAIVLLAVVFGALWLGGGLTPLPGQSRQSVELTSASFILGTLPEGAPVLVAFDFEPGFSAEMNYTAAQVVQQLVERKTKIALLSTLPTGPAMAETFMVQAGSTITDHANLGFVPGGTLGLASLVENLGGVFPYDLNGRPVWVEGPLAGIRSPSDFRLVIILTESPSTARAWIEQVQPSLGEKQIPLLMLLSAQAEPMVRPYFEGSQQVNGIIAGQAGGAAYSNLLGAASQPGEAGAGDWDALSAGLLVAAIFILAGSLVNAALLQLAPHPVAAHQDAQQKRAEGEK